MEVTIGSTHSRVMFVVQMRSSMQQRGTNSVALQDRSGCVQMFSSTVRLGRVVLRLAGKDVVEQRGRRTVVLFSVLVLEEWKSQLLCHLSVCFFPRTILCLLALQTISRRNFIPAMPVQKIVHGDLHPSFHPPNIFSSLCVLQSF